MTDLSVIIPAAGSGSRMGSDIPKPFLRLGEMTILERTIRCFDRPDRVLSIIISVSSDWLDFTRSMVQTLDVKPAVLVVEGGSERMYSIKNALAVVPAETKYIAVHDAVRPFLSSELFNALIEAAENFEAVVPGIAVTDTIKIKDDSGFVVSTPNRDTLVAVQTPQVFGKAVINEAYKLAILRDYTGTDDASLVELSGHKIRLIPGDPNNFKITWPDDIEKAEKFINRFK
ncbi:MAG TPA: 2-C-methyl-D-erythritol 4-phosphate cytidylyltransferase [Bacteroidetes bacterium]|nr:2-C-methyl-D-erythritol 4-phosphate cytidylyltransferase [Bacteroidota bacterium]